MELSETTLKSLCKIINRHLDPIDNNVISIQTRQYITGTKNATTRFRKLFLDNSQLQHIPRYNHTLQRLNATLIKYYMEEQRQQLSN